MGGAPILVTILVVFGYYHLSMYVSAEKLKFSFLFLTISLYYYEKKNTFYIASIFSVFSHYQATILYVSLFVSSSLGEFQKILKKGIVKKSLIFIVIAFIFVTLLVLDNIISKVAYYYALSNGIDEVLKLLVFFVLTLLYSKKERQQVFIIFLLLMIFAYILGGSRVNLFGYFVFLYYGLKSNNGINIGILSTTVYYLFSWFVYVNNVFEYGVNVKP